MTLWAQDGALHKLKTEMKILTRREYIFFEERMSKPLIWNCYVPNPKGITIYAPVPNPDNQNIS
jgi:hypothetical protein